MTSVAGKSNHFSPAVEIFCISLSFRDGGGNSRFTEISPAGTIEVDVVREVVCLLVPLRDEGDMRGRLGLAWGGWGGTVGEVGSLGWIDGGWILGFFLLFGGDG